MTCSEKNLAGAINGSSYMIERFYLKSCLSFDEVELELKNGLIVFSGPSGSGKSVLMRAILGSVGFEDALAQVSESSVVWQINEEDSGFENEEINVFKQVKKEKVRYLLNHQTISKRALHSISKIYLRHLSLKDYSDFEQEKMLDILDDRIMLDDETYADRLEVYKQEFSNYKKINHALAELQEKEKQIEDLREFAMFELSKIKNIDPKVDEYEYLLDMKKSLSQKDKAEEKIEQAESIFIHENSVADALNGLDINTGFFDDAMNELREHFDKARHSFDEIDNINIEELLDRLEQLSDLNRRYGSIDEALLYAGQKAKEIEQYDNFEEEKSRLTKEADKLFFLLQNEAEEISSKRSEVLQGVNTSINSYLHELYLNGAELSLTPTVFSHYGQDKVEFKLQGAPLEKISSGEFNRLRLALLAVKSESMKEQGGVLMLDEIDANLSGEESMSVARVLQKLSRTFQIFVISHQPQLTSMGDQHFLITKDTVSQVRELTTAERIDEIARMISGEKVSKEALIFAKELLESARCA